MHYPFVENQGDHTRKTLFDEYKFFAKGLIRKSDYSHEGFFLLSTKHNTFPFSVNAVTKKTHSNQECSLLAYDCETTFKGVSRLLLYLICFVRFILSHP